MFLFAYVPYANKGCTPWLRLLKKFATRIGIFLYPDGFSVPKSDKQSSFAIFFVYYSKKEYKGVLLHLYDCII